MPQTPNKKPGKSSLLTDKQKEQVYDLVTRGITQNQIAEQSQELFGIQLSRQALGKYIHQLQRDLFDVLYDRKAVTADIAYRNIKLSAKYYDQALKGDLEATNLMIKLQDQLIRLGGLQAPIKIIGDLTISIEEKEEFLQTILATATIAKETPDD